MKGKTLVLGATGKTGRRVTEKLLNLGHSVQPGSKNAEIPFDWENPKTWSKALEGIDKVYITFQPDLAIPGAAEIIHSFVEHSKLAGIEKLVLLSGRGEKETQVCENLIIESGLDCTIVRASWFMQNFSESYFLDSILTGHLVVPKVNALEPFVDVDDIADVVVAGLTSNTHSKKIYELTGPELLSFGKIVTHLSTALNRPITLQEVSMNEYVTMLREYQTPEDSIWLIQYLFTEVLDGRNESLTNDVEHVTVRKPTSFEAYAAKAKQTGVWNKPVAKAL